MNCTLSRYYHVRHKGTAHVTLDTLQVIAGSKTLNELCRMAPNFLTQSCSALWVRAFHTFRSGVSCSLFNEPGQPVKPVRTHLAVIMFRLAGRTQLSVPVKVGPFTSTLFFWKCPPWTFLFVQAASVLLQWQAFIAHEYPCCALIAQPRCRHSCSYILCLFLYVETLQCRVWGVHTVSHVKENLYCGYYWTHSIYYRTCKEAK